MPEAENRTWGAEYTIQQQNETHVAYVVQAAYPNTEHDAWAYIGRYEFAMHQATTEYVQLPSQTTIEDDRNRDILAGAIKLAPTIRVPPPRDIVYVSFDVNGLVGDVAFGDEDILAYNTHTSSWYTYFNGSDVGVLSVVNVDAFVLLADGAILFSFDIPTSVPRVGGLLPVDDSDIVKFTPVSLGSHTVGTFTMYRTATSMGLNPNDAHQDIDALGFTPEGHLLISTEGGFASFTDADLIKVGIQPPSLQLYFDGSDVGLTTSNEDVDGVWVDGSKIYLSSKGSFGVVGSQGEGQDIFLCVAESTGNTTECTFGWSPGVELFWNGSAHGLGSQNVDGLALAVVADCPPVNCGFEAGLVDWTEIVTPPFDPKRGDWTLTTEETHIGLFSARGQIVSIEVMRVTQLLSEPMSVTDVGVEYRFRFYTKGVVEAGNPTIWVYGSIYWYDNGVQLSQETEVGRLDVRDYPDWTQFITEYVCAPAGADTARFVFDLGGWTLNQDLVVPGEAGSIYIDDVWMESQQPGQCPMNGGGD